MQVKRCWRRAVDLSQKGQKLFGPVALGYPPDNLASQDVKNGIQTGGTVAFVIMCESFDLPLRPLDSVQEVKFTWSTYS